MVYIFLDESGQFTKRDNKNYFVIASVSIEEPKITAKRFRAWCRSHFPVKMRDLNEIKWSNTGISDDLRLKMLRELSRLDIHIRFVYVFNKNIPKDYIHKNKLRSGLLYTNIVGELLASYLPTDDKEFRIFCDRRRLGGMSESEFKESLRAYLLLSLSKDVVLQIEMVDSISMANVQIADWVVGALARYLEGGYFGEEFFKILQRNIIDEGRELFKE
ncbi:MAG: DUF3800 domain-containing protein [Candidatus Paceibacterota bacterium]|jgi:hypothetical protein